MFYRISIQSSAFYPVWISVNSLSIYVGNIIAAHLSTTKYINIGFVLLVVIQPTLQSVLLDRYMTWKQKILWIITDAIPHATLLCAIGIIGFVFAFNSDLNSQSQERTLATVRLVLQIASVVGAISLISACIQSLSGVLRRRRLWALWSTACWLIIFTLALVYKNSNGNVFFLIFVFGAVRSLLMGIGFQACRLREVEL